MSPSRIIAATLLSSISRVAVLGSRVIISLHLIREMADFSASVIVRTPFLYFVLEA
jgi:hypothetical protein